MATHEIYEEQPTFDQEDNRQGVHVDMGAHGIGPTEEEIDDMTPEQLATLTQSWSMNVGTNFN